MGHPAVQQALWGLHVGAVDGNVNPTRRDKFCFYNAQLDVALDRFRLYPGARYVEGFAWQNELLCPMHHGWVTFDGVHAVDVTWREPGDHYIGIVFDTATVRDRISKTGEGGELLSEIVDPELGPFREASSLRGIIRRGIGAYRA